MYVQGVMQELCSFFKVKEPQQMQEKINLLMDQIGLCRKLATLNIITPEHHDIIVANGFNPQRVKNNPRELTEKALHTILDGIK